MSNATSIILQESRNRFEAVGRAMWFGALMALPLTGLVLFFETTQPAKVLNAGGVAAHVASGPSELFGEGGVRPWVPRGRTSVARFNGVSAERRSVSAEPVIAQGGIASHAEHVLARAPYGSLKPGFYTEFVSNDRRRISLLILSREPITDRAIPDNSRLMSVTQASTAKVMSFAWGGWIYKVEIEDKGVEPEVVVQKVL